MKRLVGFALRVHRWSGIVIAVVALAWFVSGIVLHWGVSSNPSPEQRLRAHAPPLTPAELVQTRLPVASSSLREATLYRRAGQLVWLTRDLDGRTRVVDIRTGDHAGPIDAIAAIEIATRALDSPAPAQRATIVTEHDEFYRGGVPLPAFRVSFQSPPTDIYVDPVSGSVAAIIGRSQRVTRAAGEIPHFFNIEAITSRPPLQTILWITFLTGILVSTVSGFLWGIWLVGRPRKAPARRAARRNVTRALRSVHNWIGIGLTAAVLAWVVSGYFMIWHPNVSPSPDELAPTAGPPIHAEEFVFGLAAAVETLGAAGRSVLQLRLRRLLDRPVYEGVHADGTSTLVDAGDGTIISPVPSSMVMEILGRYLGGEPAVRDLRMLDRFDTYYYSAPYRNPRPLPVYRAELERGASPSRIYVAAATGDVVGRVDRSYQWFRWFGRALHTFDLPALIERPRLWDIVVLVPMMLGLILSAIGVWLGILFLYRPVRRRRLRARHRVTGSP